MGASVFVAVELTGVPYVSIMAAALLPAILYFVTVWVGIDAFASRENLAGLDAKDQPPSKKVLITSAFFAIPIAALLFGMYWLNVTPQYAVCIATLVSFVLLFLTVTGLRNSGKQGIELKTQWFMRRVRFQ